MSGVTTSADIWSVGCTAIELLTTVPPFYELQPMSALFRIVKVKSPQNLEKGAFHFSKCLFWSPG